MPYSGIYKAPYTQKPPSSVRPNLGHPLLKDAVNFISLREGGGDTRRDDITNKQFTGTSGHIWLSDGLRANSPSKVGQIINLGTGIGATDWEGYSVVCRIRAYIQDGTSVEDSILSGWQTSGKKSCWFRTRQDLDSLRFTIENNSGTNVTVFETAGGVEDEKWHVVVASWDTRSDEVFLAIDGVVVASSTLTGSVTDMSSDETFIADTPHNTTDEGRFDYDFIGIFQRGVSKREAKAWHDNPYQIYTRPLPIWIDTGAGPTGWQGTMNEISTPTAINEQARTSITSVNEVT